MAKGKPALIEVKCPCCDATLQIDAGLKAVISHQEAEKPHVVEDIAVAVQRLKGEEARRAGCQHRGRFDGGQLDKFDASGRAKGDQFRYSRNKDGAFSTRGNEALPTPEFRALAVKIEGFLRQHGRDIYDGNVSVAPFRWKHETACDFCLYRPVCRFDPWTQPYRVLRAPEKP